MTAFLDKLADAIRAGNDQPLDGTAVVLPSQRAAVFLRRALARNNEKAQWSPEFLTLSSFMERIAGVRVMPMDELLFEGYEAYRTAAGPGSRPFDDFITWAPTALNDFSEADSHLVHMEGFYKDLRSWEELDWSFNTTPLSPGQERSVRYWALASKWHAILNARSLARGAGTNGWVERTAATSGLAFPWSRVWFAGLNAFTPAELAVIDRAHGTGIARFAWDADVHYVDDHLQEAGSHLRRAIHRFGKGEVAMDDRLRSASHRISSVVAPNNVAQAWCAAQALMDRNGTTRQATIVLADEALLRPLLEALPGDLGPVNITMGVSLSQLPVATLLEGFFRALVSENRARAWSPGVAEEVLRHPFIRNGASVTRIDALIRDLSRQDGGIRSHAEWTAALAALDPDAQDLPLRAMGDPEMPAYQRVVALLGWAQRRMEGDTLATEQLYSAAILLRRMDGLIQRYAMDASASAWSSFLPRIMRGARIGLFGEPLSGVQIMGLLESRALDHGRVVLLGAQEGQLPSSSLDQSYIPFEIRRHYGLPLRDSTDAVQAYNFLRIVQHAEEIVLVRTDDASGQGPSRFIAQLEQELPDGEGAFLEHSARAPVEIGIPVPMSIKENTMRRSVLLERCAAGLSPTLLSAWRRCPLDHWFRYVVGLREPEAITASIPANVLGEAVHDAMHKTYEPWLGKALAADGMERSLAAFPAVFSAELARELGGSFPLSGQPLLQSNMAQRAGMDLLQGEGHLVRIGRRIVPLALETEYAAPLALASAQVGVPVRVKGRIDRVDDRDGIRTLLDLKTGHVDPAALRLKDISNDLSPADTRDRSQALQLLVYAWLYMVTNPSIPQVRAGLLPLQRANASEGIFLHIEDRDMITRGDLPAIEAALSAIVADMLDPAGPIMHSPMSRFCAFCAQP